MKHSPAISFGGTLTKDQVYAIRRLAMERFPELAAPVIAARNEARQRMSQASGKPRGAKALARSPGPRESADVIGVHLGVSGTTVKRVERLMRTAPELVYSAATGRRSIKQALKELSAHQSQSGAEGRTKSSPVRGALRRVRHAIREEWAECPAADRARFIYGLREELRALMRECALDSAPSRAAG